MNIYISTENYTHLSLVNQLLLNKITIKWHGAHIGDTLMHFCVQQQRVASGQLSP